MNRILHLNDGNGYMRMDLQYVRHTAAAASLPSLHGRGLMKTYSLSVSNGMLLDSA